MTAEQSPTEIYRGNARVFAAAMNDRYGVELRCGRAGAEWLDQFFASRSEALDPTTLSRLTQLVGCFVGECVIHEYGGGWDDEGWSVRITGSGRVDPFWMAESCLRYRGVYRIPELFAGVPAIARVPRGGLFATRNEDGSFGVRKVLAVDHVAVHLRKYGNRFDECPSHLDPASLSIGMDFKAWLAKGSPVSELAIGHFPLAHAGFWDMKPVLLRVDPVGEEELDGYRVWLTGTSPPSGGESTRPVGRAAVSKKWWQFWKSS
jgi:hypothetical protein